MLSASPTVPDNIQVAKERNGLVCRSFKDAFGDVSLMLAAMGAEHLLPTFESHGVGFREMLTLDDAALSKVMVPLGRSPLDALPSGDASTLLLVLLAQVSSLLFRS